MGRENQKKETLLQDEVANFQAKIDEVRSRSDQLKTDQAELEAEKMRMRLQGHHAGLRILRQTLYYRVKGEAGLRFEIWRSSLYEARAATG